MKEQILILALHLRNVFPCWRYGQAVFNATYELYPEIADAIRGTKTDCYYNSNNVNVFLQEIEKYEKCIKPES